MLLQAFHNASYRFQLWSSCYSFDKGTVTHEPNLGCDHHLPRQNSLNNVDLQIPMNWLRDDQSDQINFYPNQDWLFFVIYFGCFFSLSFRHHRLQCCGSRQHNRLRPQQCQPITKQPTLVFDLYSQSAVSIMEQITSHVELWGNGWKFVFWPHQRYFVALNCLDKIERMLPKIFTHWLSEVL